MATLKQEDSKPIDNPYVGPRTFTAEEANLFFGRDREARNLLALIVSERLVLFYSQSGAGKSSLINTRIIPGLAAEGFEVLPVGRVSGAQVEAGIENIFAYNLLVSLHQGRTIPAAFQTMTLSHFLDNLIYEGRRFRYDNGYIYAQDATLKPRVLLIDQFEEILSSNAAYWQHRAGFFQQLDEALRLDDQLWVVLTMREDFVAGLDPYLHYLPNNMRNRYYMQRLDREAALEAVMKPARLAGRPFTEGAAELLVDNLRQIRTAGSQEEVHLDQFVEPVQFQAVCYQMWEKLKTHPDTVITTNDVRDFADVDTALVSFYEATIADTVAQTGVSEVELRNWFETALITEAGTRSMVYRGQKTTSELPTPVADHVHKRFIIRQISRPGGVWYELVHDRFVQPIQQANQVWRLEQPLPRLAQKWADAGRSQELLLDGSELQRWQESNWQGLGPLVVAFMEASQGREEARLKEAEEAHRANERREMEQQAALAAAERRRADEEKAARVKERQLTKWVSAVGLIAVMAAILAIIFLFEANENANLANAESIRAATEEAEAEAAATAASISEAKAKAEQEMAEAAQIEAEAARTEAEAARTQIYSLRLADQAKRWVEQGQVEGALLLGRTAVLSDTTVQSQGALLYALNAAADPFRVQADPAVVAAFRRDLLVAGIVTGTLSLGPEHGTVAAVHNGGIIYWNVMEETTFTHTVELSHTDLYTVAQIVFSPRANGGLLATSSGADIRLWWDEDGNGVWQQTDGEELAEGSSIRAMALNQEGNQLAVIQCKPTTSQDSTKKFDCSVNRWPIENGQFGTLSTQPAISGPELVDLAFTETGLLWSSSTEVGLLSNDGLLRSVVSAEEDYHFVSLDFVEPDNWLVVGGGCFDTALCSGFVRWWSLAEETWLAPATLLSTRVEALAYIEQPGQLVAAAGNGLLVQWEMDTEKWETVACQIAGRNLTIAEWEEAFPQEQTYTTTCAEEEFDFGLHPTVIEWLHEEAKTAAQRCQEDRMGEAEQLYRQANPADENNFTDWVVPILLDTALRTENEGGMRDCLARVAAQNVTVDEETFMELRSSLLEIDESAGVELQQFDDQYEEQRTKIEGPVAAVVDKRLAELLRAACFGPGGPAADFCVRYNGRMEQFEISPGFVPITLTDSTELVDNWTFTGNSGEIIAIALNVPENETPSLRLVDANDYQIAYGSSSGDSRKAIIETVLAVDGSYSVEVSWFITRTDYTLAVTQTQPVVIAVSVTEPATAATAEQQWWQFSGQAGEFVAIDLNTSEGIYPFLRLLDAGGREITNSFSSDGRNAAIEVRLPARGSYYLEVRWANLASNYTLAVAPLEPTVLDTSGATVSASADQRLWQFEGERGNHVAIAMNALFDGDPYLRLLNTNGHEITYNDDGGDGLNSLIETILPEDGIYYVDAGWLGAAGEYTLAVNQAQPAIASVNGPAAEATAEQRRWQFDGQGGRLVIIDLNAAEGSYPFLQLLDVNGDEIEQDDGDGRNASLQTVLPANGTYYVDIGWYTVPSNYSLSVIDREPTILSANATPLITTTEQRWWQLVGQRGQLVTIDLNAAEGSYPFLRLLDINNREITNNYSNDGSNATIEALLLTNDNYYLETLLSGPGTYTVTATLLEPAVLVTQTVAEATAEQRWWRFEGELTSIIAIALNAPDGGNPSLQLIGANGQPIAYASSSTDGRNFLIQTMLPADGIYYAETRWFEAPHDYTLSMTEIEPVILQVGETRAATAEQRWWQFSGQHGEMISIAMNGLASHDPYLRLFDANGQLITNSYSSSNRRNSLLEIVLPENGTYYLQVGWVTTPGDYILAITTLEPPMLIAGQVVAEAAAEQHWWQFDADRGDFITIAMDALESGDPYLQLFDSNHQLIATNDDGGEGRNSLIQTLLREDGIYYIEATWLGTPSSYVLTLNHSRSVSLPTTMTPQECGLETADYGPLLVGRRIILGSHRPVDGSSSWSDTMFSYVGQEAVITSLGGVDGVGCPVVYVDLDGGVYPWRIRDLFLLEE
jgi:hypothetical protein